MTGFEFKTDDQSEKFCCDVIEEMVVLFSISKQEALGRMNRLWKGLEFLGSEDLIYHEDETYWAMTIYYGKGSNWWANPVDLKPLPYP